MQQVTVEPAAPKQEVLGITVVATGLFVVLQRSLGSGFASAAVRLCAVTSAGSCVRVPVQTPASVMKTAADAGIAATEAS